ncbi:hypothetical protein Q8A67_024320 [Cirrhinus molitorella]|uniref:AAA+ ATPase domain-containing protein n=1 Tax=Cirrhinus molitorella TaxID=172907 RepID=A0AA88TBP1_9TELE|nr:hypothetical protein Q8A67_024320 [Cirrhinus molitorella]
MVLMQELVMADSQSMSKWSEVLDTPLTNKLSEILTNSKLIEGPTARYILNPTILTDGELLRKQRIGQNNEDKPRKVILMIGETGTGKSTLINAMISYIMGVRWEHNIWLEVCEISDEQTESQTKAVTLYEVYAQDSPFSLAVIDTPGFGDTEGFEKDKCVAEALEHLFRSEDGIHEIHTVCLVLKATDARLHERQRYILDEMLSLFGKDIEKNIVLLFTHQEKKTLPKRVLNFVKESLSKYMKNDEYICFQFDNCQSECFDQEDRESYKASWDNGIENFRKFFSYLNEINPKSLHLTEGVLRVRKQLDACVNNLRDRIELADLKKQELEQTKAALDAFLDANNRENQNNFQYVVQEHYREEVPINASWWQWSKQATRCTECKENCHYPGCWWVSDLSKCIVMSKGKCKICSGECEPSKHKKDEKKYVTKIRKVTKTNDDLKKKYEEELGNKNTLMTKLENEIQCTEAEKIRLVEECYQCLERLMETALKSTSVSSFRHLDFMIEKVKETGKQERVQKLEELKMRAAEENKGLTEMFCTYMKNL